MCHLLIAPCALPFALVPPGIPDPDQRDLTLTATGLNLHLKRGEKRYNCAILAFSLDLQAKKFELKIGI